MVTGPRRGRGLRLRALESVSPPYAGQGVWVRGAHVGGHSVAPRLVPRARNLSPAGPPSESGDKGPTHRNRFRRLERLDGEGVDRIHEFFTIGSSNVDEALFHVTSSTSRTPGPKVRRGRPSCGGTSAQVTYRRNDRLG